MSGKGERIMKENEELELGKQLSQLVEYQIVRVRTEYEAKMNELQEQLEKTEQERATNARLLYEFKRKNAYFKQTREGWINVSFDGITQEILEVKKENEGLLKENARLIREKDSFLIESSIETLTGSFVGALEVKFKERFDDDNWEDGDYDS